MQSPQALLTRQAPEPAADHLGDTGIFSAQHAEYLERLAGGGGLSKWELIGFFEQCDCCGLTFTGAALRQHLPYCKGKGKGKGKGKALVRD